MYAAPGDYRACDVGPLFSEVEVCAKHMEASEARQFSPPGKPCGATIIDQNVAYGGGNVMWGHDMVQKCGPG